jgi:hypothetical protein
MTNPPVISEDQEYNNPARFSNNQYQPVENKKGK